MGLLRLLLALSVVNAHAPFSSLPLFLRGDIAVIIFYMISGFYMSLILNDAYATRPGALKRFYLNRALRIYPTYYAALAASFVYYTFVAHGETVFTADLGLSLGRWLTLIAVNITVIGLDVTRMLGAAGYDATFVYGGYYIPFAWSIGIELTFYLFAPFLTRLGPTATALWIGVGVGGRLVMAALGADEIVWRYLFSPSVMVFFLIGHAARLGYHRLRSFPYLNEGGGVAIMAVALIFVGTPLGGGGLYGGDIDHWKNWLFYFAMAATLPFLFALTRTSKLDNAVGQLSYPLYLGHLLVIVVAGDRGWFTGESGNLWVAAVALAYAWLLHGAVEYPLASLRDRIAGRDKRAPKPRTPTTIARPRPAAALFWLGAVVAFYNALFVLYPAHNYVFHTHDATMAGEFWRGTDAVGVTGSIPLQLPGPADGWAGGGVKEFSLRLPYGADTRLTLWTRDSHDTAPPKLELVVDDAVVAVVDTPAGSGGAPHTWSLSGKAAQLAVTIPGDRIDEGSLLRVRNVAGSWVVFDAVTFQLSPTAGQRWSALIFGLITLGVGGYAVATVPRRET